MDAAELKATLARLSEVVPVAATEADAALEAGGAALEDARELVSSLGTLVDESEQTLTETEEYIAAMVTFAEERQSEVDEAANTLADAIESFSELEAGIDALEGATAAVEESFEAMKDKLTEGAEAAKAAAEQYAESLEGLFGAMQDAQEQASAAMDQVKAAFDELQGALEAGRDTLADELDTMASALAEKQSELLDEVEGYVSDGEKWMGELGTTLTDSIPAALKAELDSAFDEVERGIREQLQALVNEALDKVSEALGGFGEKLEEAETGSKAARELLEPLFDQFDTLANPLVSAIDSIKDAASTVGIDF